MNPEIDLTAKQHKFLRSVNHHLVFQLFLLLKLPAAWFAGLKVVSLTNANAIVSVKHRWFNQNPFQSIYFAVLAMAAELSTGLLCMMYVKDDQIKVSMLVVGVKASFMKKAVGINRFICDEGIKIQEAIEEAKRSKEAVSLEIRSTGYSAQNEEIAIFDFLWSFKVK